MGTPAMSALTRLLRLPAIPCFCRNTYTKQNTKTKNNKNGTISTNDGMLLGSVLTNKSSKTAKHEPLIISNRFIVPILRYSYKEKYCSICTLQYFSL